MVGLGVNGKRMSLKSCSDSSLDGRSSDSMYTNSSGSFECCGCGTAGGSRWRNHSNATTKLPLVEKLNVNGTGFARQSYRNPYDEMTNYTASNKSHLNSTYPKLSHSFYHRKQQKKSQGEFILITFIYLHIYKVYFFILEISKEIGEKGLSASVIEAAPLIDGDNKRFVNVEKFKNG